MCSEIKSPPHEKRNNLLIASKRDNITLAFITVKMLDHMSESYTKLKDESRYSQILRETQRKQHLSHRLTNISDDVFDLFMMLDEQRALLTENLLNKLGPDVLINLLSQLQDNKPLKDAFHSILNKFEMSETHLVINKQLFLTSIGSLFDDIVHRYCRIADDQDRKQLHSKIGHTKTERLRKAIGRNGPKSIVSVSMTEI